MRQVATKTKKEQGMRLYHPRGHTDQAWLQRGKAGWSQSTVELERDQKLELGYQISKPTHSDQLLTTYSIS